MDFRFWNGSIGKNIQVELKQKTNSDSIETKMFEDELKGRMKAFAVQIMQLIDELPKTMTATILARQLLRASTSIGANYRSACRAKSKADFVAKLAIVEEEADEAMYWLDLLIAGKFTSEDRVRPLLEEANEFVAIAVSSIKTIRQSHQDQIKPDLDSKIQNQNSKIITSPSSSLA